MQKKARQSQSSARTECSKSPAVPAPRRNDGSVKICLWCRNERNVVNKVHPDSTAENKGQKFWLQSETKQHESRPSPAAPQPSVCSLKQGFDTVDLETKKMCFLQSFALSISNSYHSPQLLKHVLPETCVTVEIRQSTNQSRAKTHETDDKMVNVVKNGRVFQPTLSAIPETPRSRSDTRHFEALQTSRKRPPTVKSDIFSVTTPRSY
ncbi:unnamed protein product [Soboliphyme baturini]|uniref:Si:ch73-389k6.1 n=1 Tax=Soboliphyme baturini TaxID=241478 RepID=A0A183IP52_9BILA|nr:unnamed protein product [Soboliphyme baturini]